MFDDQNVGSHKMNSNRVFILFKKMDFNKILGWFVCLFVCLFVFLSEPVNRLAFYYNNILALLEGKVYL